MQTDPNHRTLGIGTGWCPCGNHTWAYECPASHGVEAMRAIRERDPDGWATREPTAADYQQFERWVTATYGTAAWRHYHDTNWDVEVMR